MSKIEEILHEYEQGKQDSFKFFAFWSPPITDEQYGWVKECGYTHLLIDRKYDAEFGSEKMGHAVKLAEKHGLYSILSTGDFMAHEHPYADNPMLDGTYVDEPLSIGELEVLTRKMEAFQEKYPGKCFYVNLVGMNGRSWDIYSEYFKNNYLTKANRKTVSGDRYPLRQDKTGECLMDSTFLDYVRRIGKLADETGSEMYFFVQTMSIHGNVEVRRPTEEDIRFLHYVILSCGAKGFQHFCYMTPGLPPYRGEFKEDDWACIHQDGYRTEIWYAAQKVIAEFKRFENVFLKFHWKGLLPVYGAQAASRCENFAQLGEFITSHSYIKDVKAQEDLLIGCFEDDDGNVGLSLVNFSDPGRKKKNEVVLVLAGQESIAETVDGVVREVSIADGRYAVTLAPGEGRFLILSEGNPAAIETHKVEKPEPAYLKPPSAWEWKENFALGNQVDTYNVYGSGNSHFEFMDSGYPEGGSGRVLRLYNSTHEEKDWSSYKFSLPDIPYDENKKLVFKVFFTGSAFDASLCCDLMDSTCKRVRVYVLEQFGRWTWLSVPLKDIWHEGMDKLSEVMLCIGDGVPYGTTAYIDEIMLCEMREEDMQ